MRIYCIGYMGSGKSTLGKELSMKLKYHFIDLDKEIEKETGKTIDLIFDKEGEKQFRIYEKQLLRETEISNNIVVATGGGTPCFLGNMDFMNQHGVTVYLKMSAGALFRRLLRDKAGRPLLKDMSDVDMMEQIMVHLAKRAPFYSNAKYVVDVEERGIEKLSRLFYLD